MGRYRVELDLGRSPWLCSIITITIGPLIGNLGVDLLMMALAPLIGLEPAVKLIVLADPAADRRRLPVGRARSARTGSADRLFRDCPSPTAIRSCSAS